MSHIGPSLAGILMVTAGRPNLILPKMVCAGAVVIDVGISRLPDVKLVGDVDFEGVQQRTSDISPVPWFHISPQRPNDGQLTIDVINASR